MPDGRPVGNSLIPHAFLSGICPAHPGPRLPLRIIPNSWRPRSSRRSTRRCGFLDTGPIGPATERAPGMRGVHVVVLAALIASVGFGWRPADGQTGGMPPGHPPVSSPPSPAPGSPSLPPGHPPTGGPHALPDTVSDARGLLWTAPVAWKEESPSSAMRRAQYRIPGPGGDGECAVFYFGPGQGGDAQSNIARWAGQFRRPDGSPVGDAFKTREINVRDIPVLLVEVTGTYVGGMGGGPAGPERPNYMLLGAIAKGPDANWFFRATGPRATIEAQRAAFERMIRSLKRGQPL